MVWPSNRAASYPLLASAKFAIDFSVTTDTAEEEKSIITKQALSLIFYPLFKCGAIEFYGDSQYGLSPTTCLYNREFILCCNFPDEIVIAPKENMLYVRPGDVCDAIFGRRNQKSKIHQRSSSLF